MLVCKTIILLIKISILHAEGTGEIKHHTTGSQECWRDVVAHLMGSREENNVDAFGRGGNVNQRL
ncbi:hypothetical protein D3C77_594950 [compost metagenome]